MAFSPTTTIRSPAAGSTPLKLRALTVLQKPTSSTSTPASETASNEASSSEMEPLQDLSEQMNAAVRDKYVKDEKLGEGTYANVYKAHLRSDPTQFFAIKKIKTNTEFKDGISLDTVREMKTLQELHHPNIICLHDVFSTKDQNMNLVLEFLLGDLEQIIKDPINIKYTPADIKSWTVMLMRGVYWCHRNFILHRDIKPNNLLIAADGNIKLADFGLARMFADPYDPMTFNVITRWYRPPELFYRAQHYSGAVDIWSCACVLAELVLRVPFLQGNTDLATVDEICQRLGTPTEENWPGVSKLKGYVAPAPTNIHRFQLDMFRSTFAPIGEVGIDLLRKMFYLDPRKRLTAEEVLQHEWWTTGDRPTEPKDLPKKKSEKKVGEDLKRRGGELPSGGVAKKLDFGAAKR